MPKSQIKVIKLHLSREDKNRDYPKAFRRIPQLYLELLENKSKIKQDFINKDHIANKSISLSPNKSTKHIEKYQSPKISQHDDINIIDSEDS
jgi:hypothetical protein